MTVQSFQTALKTRNIDHLNCAPLTSDIHPFNDQAVQFMLDHISKAPVICHDLMRKMNKRVFQEASETFDIVNIKVPHDEFVLYDTEFNSAVYMMKVPPTDYIGDSLTCFVFSDEEHGNFCMNPVSVAVPLEGGQYLYDNYIRTNKNPMELGDMAMENIGRALFILHGLKNLNFTIKKKNGIKTVHAPERMTTKFRTDACLEGFDLDRMPNVYPFKSKVFH